MKMTTYRPIRMWIDGKSFNLTKFNQPKQNQKGFLQQNQKGFLQQNKSGDTNLVSDCSNFDIQTTESGKFSTSFRLPSYYYIKLNSFPYFNTETFENETSTDLSVPKNGQDGNITIVGDREHIINARNILHSMIGAIRERQRPAQFISIPLHNKVLHQNFVQFKNEILNGEPIDGMDESIFQKPEKLHLTLTIFALMDDTEKTEAMNALDDCKTVVVMPLLSGISPVKIKVCGINCMNTNFAKVNILYADANVLNEQGENILQKVADGISNYFYDRGFVKDNRENVKLHVTLINTKYRSSPNSPKKIKGSWGDRKRPFDARSVMEKYKEYDFGESTFESIHISIMSSIGEDGFYKPLSIVNV